MPSPKPKHRTTARAAVEQLHRTSMVHALQNAYASARLGRIRFDTEHYSVPTSATDPGPIPHDSLDHLALSLLHDIGVLAITDGRVSIR